MSTLDVKRECQNVSQFVRFRQIHRLRPGSQSLSYRRLAQFIHPTNTIHNAVSLVNSPFVPRRFTPDGRLLVGAGVYLKNILVFRFNGAGSGESVLQAGPNQTVHAPKDILAKYFTLKWSIPMSSEQAPVQIHTSLVTPDSRFLLAMVRSRQRYASMSTNVSSVYGQQLSENVPLDGVCGLQHWTLYVIDLLTGGITRQQHFDNDVLCSPEPDNHLTCYLHNYTFVVLSVPKQAIRFFHLASDGSMVPGNVIGRFCLPDDEAVFNQPLHTSLSTKCTKDDIEPIASNCDATFSSLKQKLLTYLHRSCQATGQLSQFFRSFSALTDMRVSSLQMLSEDMLLLRYDAFYRVWRKMPERGPELLAVYDVQQACFVEVSPAQSFDMSSLLWKHNDALSGHAGATPSHSLASLQREVIRLRQFEGDEAVGQYVASCLPLQAQTASYSPLVDLSVFNLRPSASLPFKLVDFAEGVWQHGNLEERIDFICQESRQVKFTLQHLPDGMRCEQRLMIFHPHEPIAFSVACCPLNGLPVISLHVRFQNTGL